MGEVTEREALQTAVGDNGVVTVSDTTTVTGLFRAIQPLSNVEFTGVVELNATGSLNGLTVGAGNTIFGKFTSVTLASGTARLYR